jgi:hypothetical protein
VLSSKYLIFYVNNVEKNNEELHKLYFSPSMIRMIRPRRMRWAEHIALMEKRNSYKTFMG